MSPLPSIKTTTEGVWIRQYNVGCQGNFISNDRELDGEEEIEKRRPSDGVLCAFYREV